MKRALRTAFFGIAICLSSYAQETPAQETAKDALANQVHGLPPRTAPTEYQAQVKAGAVTIAAEFKGHSIPTMQGTFSTEDYVVVEAGLFGPPEARLKLSMEDFSLRINGKKPLASQPYGLVLGSVKDPEWEPPEPPEKKGKGGGLSTGGQGGQQDNSPPPVPKMPFPLVRAMGQKVQKSALAEGDRALPQAGLLFFSYRGKQSGIRSVELIYTGPAGKATVALP